MNAPAAGEAPASTTSILSVLDSTPPELLAVRQQAGGLMEIAKAYVIDCPAMFQAAADDLNLWRGQYRTIEATRKHLKEPFLEGGRRIDALFDPPKTALEAAAKALGDKMAAYKAEEDRKAEEARRAEEQRRRQEREELERQQREAEETARKAREELERQEREAAENARKAREEAERVELEARERAAAEQRRASEEAAAARDSGDEEAARAAEEASRRAQEQADREAEEAREKARVAQEQANREAEEARENALRIEQEQAQRAAEVQAEMDIADVAPAAMTVQSAAVASGVSGRTTWKVKSIDKAELVKAAAAALESGNDQLLAYLVVDEKVLNGVARSLKSAARVPGVVFGPETSMAATGRGR